MLLLKKKKYVAVKLQFMDGIAYEEIEQKGLDMVRRDWSLLAIEIGDFCLSQILSGRSCEDVVESIHDSLIKVAHRLQQSGYSTGWSVGDTVPYVICHEEVSLLFHSAVSALMAGHAVEPHLL